MIDHEATPAGIPNNSSDVVSSGQRAAIGPVDNPHILARLIRAAYADAIAIDTERETDFSPMDMVRAFNTHDPAPGSELTNNIKTYPFSERLTIVPNKLGTQVVMGSRSEVNQAFELVHGYDQGLQPGEMLARIGTRNYRVELEDHDGTWADAEAKAEQTVRRVSDNFAAHARRAEAALRRLSTERANLKRDLDDGARYDSLYEYFTAATTPSFDGPGQLTRYIDAVAAVAGKAGEYSPYDGKFQPKLAKNNARRSMVVDPYISPQAPQGMEAHRQEVLSRISIDDADLLFEYAVGNEGSLLNFWNLQLAKAKRHDVAGPAAAAALEAS